MYYATIGAILVESQSWHVFIGLSAMTKADGTLKEYLNGLNKMSRIREIVRRWLTEQKKRNDVEVQMVH